jgi:hypothetical protein
MHNPRHASNRNRHARSLRDYQQEQSCTFPAILLTGTDMHIIWETTDRNRHSYSLRDCWQEQKCTFSERLLTGTDTHIFWEAIDRNRYAHFLRGYWQDQTFIFSERLLTGANKHIFWENTNRNTDAYSQQATVFTAVNYKRNECTLIRIGQKNNIPIHLLESIKVNLYNTWKLPDNRIQVQLCQCTLKYRRCPKCLTK